MQLRSFVRFALPAAALILPCILPAQADKRCIDFEGVTQMKLGDAVLDSGVHIYTWTGPTYLNLGGEEWLITVKDFADAGGNPPVQTAHGTWTLEDGAKVKLDFGDGNTLTLEGTGAFPSTAAKAYVSVYSAIYKIVGGSGRFRGASGVVTETGPYIVWFPNPNAPPEGRYNGRFSGKVCTP